MRAPLRRSATPALARCRTSAPLPWGSPSWRLRPHVQTQRHTRAARTPARRRIYRRRRGTLPAPLLCPPAAHRLAPPRDAPHRRQHPRARTRNGGRRGGRRGRRRRARGCPECLAVRARAAATAAVPLLCGECLRRGRRARDTVSRGSPTQCAAAAAAPRTAILASRAARDAAKRFCASICVRDTTAPRQRGVPAQLQLKSNQIKCISSRTALDRPQQAATLVLTSSTTPLRMRGPGRHAHLRRHVRRPRCLRGRDARRVPRLPLHAHHVAPRRHGTAPAAAAAVSRLQASATRHALTAAAAMPMMSRCTATAAARSAAASARSVCAPTHAPSHTPTSTRSAAACSAACLRRGALFVELFLPLILQEPRGRGLVVDCGLPARPPARPPPPARDTTPTCEMDRAKTHSHIARRAGRRPQHGRGAGARTRPVRVGTPPHLVSLDRHGVALRPTLAELAVVALVGLELRRRYGRYHLGGELADATDTLAARRRQPIAKSISEITSRDLTFANAYHGKIRSGHQSGG